MVPNKMLRCKACGRLIPVNKSECPFCGAANDNVQNVQEEQPVVSKPVEAPVAKHPAEVKVAEPAFAAPPAAEPIAPASSTSASPEPEPIRTEGTVASSKSRKPIILAALAALLLVVGIVLYLCVGGKKEAGDEVQTADMESVDVVDVAPISEPEPEPETIDTAAIVKAKVDSIKALGYKIIGDYHDKVFYLKNMDYYEEKLYMFDVIEDRMSSVPLPMEGDADHEITEFAIVKGRVVLISYWCGSHRNFYAIRQYDIEKKKWLNNKGDYESATFTKDKTKVKVNEVVVWEGYDTDEGYRERIESEPRIVNL